MSVLPQSWIDCRLGDVVEYGKTTKAEPNEIPDDAWVLELEDIEKDTSKIFQRLTFAQRQSKSTKNRFYAGDVLYGKLRPYLNKVVRADQDGYCTTEIIPLPSSRWLDSSYLFYWLKHPAFLDYVTSVSHGLNMPRLGTEAGNAAPFVLAPLNEQKRIADKLDAVLARVDACRERLDRVPAILKRFRQSVLAAATSGKLTEEWREEHKSQGEWRAALIGTLLNDIRYGTAKKCQYEPQQTPVLRIPNVIDGKVNHEDIKYAEFDDGELSKLALSAGDILMIRSNGSLGLVGRTALVSDREAGFLYAGYLIRLRFNQSLILPAYASLALSSPQSRDAIELVARSTSGVNNINTEEIKALEISLPGIEEQQEIIRRVEELFAYADRLEARYAAARAQVERLTPALLAKAFRGELVPQDPSDEPASALLERIRAGRSNQPGAARRGRKLKQQEAVL